MPWITLFYQHCKKMISRMEQLSKTISVVPRIIFQHQHSCIHTAKILGHANEISYLPNFILTNLLRGRHLFFLRIPLARFCIFQCMLRFFVTVPISGLLHLWRAKEGRKQHNDTFNLKKQVFLCSKKESFF